VLIFSQMTMMLDILEDFLVDMGYKYARYGCLINLL
jgi:chromodomain-helicase-DNA-binding protein 4